MKFDDRPDYGSILQSWTIVFFKTRVNLVKWANFCLVME